MMYDASLPCVISPSGRFGISRLLRELLWVMDWQPAEAAITHSADMLHAGNSKMRESRTYLMGVHSKQFHPARPLVPNVADTGWCCSGSRCRSEAMHFKF